MVVDRKKLHIVSLLFTRCLLIVSLIFSITIENKALMGIMTISPEEYNVLLSKESSEFDVEILFNGIPAATDEINNIIYISEKIDDNSRITDMAGTLSVSNPNYQLFFVEDESVENISENLAGRDKYKVIVMRPDETYTEYSVVFTTLPVLNINGIPTAEDSVGRIIHTGKIQFFDSLSAETGEYRTVSTNASWRARGNSTLIMTKKSWKISLENNSGEKENISFCGLGEDDDWILNSMSFDDLCLREKLTMDLWNSDKIFIDNKAPMSRGEYVEVVYNGEYVGLYLLQRRLDKKYLNLDDNSILIKGNSVVVANPNIKYYEIEHSPYTEEETISFLEKNFFSDITSNVNIENLIETNIFINMICATDNCLEKNIFRIIRNIDNNYEVNYLLWDTDMSFGMSWDESIGFIYDFDGMLTPIVYRYDFYDIIQKKPTLETLIAKRWFELRNSIFSTENITTHVEELFNTITYSGSLQRDHDKWGLHYSGEDNMENFYKYINMRMKFLDEYYSMYI
ncbi:MAG: CotH kinase family protein [Oscillospiraceae bacterium]|nr:CotH kinase family protein [Oscillospiraceae bacterium]